MQYRKIAIQPGWRCLISPFSGFKEKKNICRDSLSDSWLLYVGSNSSLRGIRTDIVVVQHFIWFFECVGLLLVCCTYLHLFVCLKMICCKPLFVCLFNKMFCCMRLAVLSCFEIASVPKGQTALGGGGFNWHQHQNTDPEINCLEYIRMKNILE